MLYSVIVIPPVLVSESIEEEVIEDSGVALADMYTAPYLVSTKYTLSAGQILYILCMDYPALPYITLSIHNVMRGPSVLHLIDLFVWFQTMTKRSPILSRYLILR